jgi:hypothetical protein
MKVTNIIEAKQWRRKHTNVTASIYGAVPWTSLSDAHNWIVEVKGYTWVTDQGTIGLGRMPAKTMQEAIEVMNKVNSL